MALAEKVVEKLHKDPNIQVPSVEDIQDIVERVLIEEGLTQTAKIHTVPG